MKLTLTALLGWALCASLICATAGCGGGSTQPESEGEDETISVKKVSAAKLPALEDYLPPLDDGRIELAAPKDWTTMSREAKYVARFIKGDALSLPRILVTVDPSDIDGLDTADEDNVTELARQTAANLKQRKAALLEDARPMLLGDNAFARYVLKSKYRGAPIERQMLQTVVDGRLYTVDLQVATSEDLKKYRDDAYAVAAGLKFPKAGTAATPADEPEKPAEP